MIEEMEMPTPCVHCGETFDLADGFGSDKWHKNVVICPDCHNKEEEEIEEDERLEILNDEIMDSLHGLDEDEDLFKKLNPETINLIKAVYNKIVDESISYKINRL